MVGLSSLDVLYLAREISVLQDAYIDKIYEVDPGTFLFRARHPDRGKMALLLRPGAYACLVDEPPETPQSPTSFATLLRKHLPSLRVRSVDQHEFDRVLVFHLDDHGEPVRLIVELFGKGNLILVGPDDTTRLAQRTETFKDRTIRRGEAFKFPQSRVNPVRLAQPDFDRLAAGSERDAVRFLATDAAFGPDLAEELLHRSRVAKDRKASDLTDSERDGIWKAWLELQHGKADPGVAEMDGKIRVESVPLGSPKFAGWTRRAMPTLSAAIDEARKVTAVAEAVPVRSEEAERLDRQIEHQTKAIAELKAEADRWEARGRAAYENYAGLQTALEAASELLGRHEWGELPVLAKKGELPPLIAAVDANARRIDVRVGDGTFRIDPTQNIDANASTYFEEAKRLRAKMESALLAVEDARKRLTQADKPRPTEAAKKKAPEKRFWFESFRWFFTTEDFLVVGGRDAGSNEKLVKKHLAPGDVYFHADVHGAPSCVLKGEGRAPSEASLRQAAQFAASFSRAFSQFGSADAYWVKPEQVSKTAMSGEFIAKGSFMVRGTRNYIPSLPMEVGVGAVRLGRDGKPALDGSFARVTGGPVEAIEARAKKWVVVVRGDQKPAEVLRDLSAFFGVSHDEVQNALPAGTLRVARRSEGA